MKELPAIDKFAARVLMVSFFLPMKLQGLATMAVGVYFVVRTFVAKEKVPAINYLLALLISSGYLLFLLSLPFTPHEYLKPLREVCEHRVSFLLMPFAFAIIMPSFGALITGELMYFVYACFITCVAGNADFAYHYYHLGGDAQSLSQVQYRTIFHQFTDIHPTYMGMYLCFAICILLFSPAFNTRRAAIVKYTFLFSLFLFLLALGPKTPIIALAIIFVHYAYMHRAALSRHKAVLGGLVAAIVAAWYFIPFFSQRVKETIQGLGSTDSADNSISMRKVIWNMDTSLLKHYWLTGVGPGRIMQSLREHYFFYSMINPIPVPYHDPHSEYFYEWLCFGLPGILLFVTILFLHARKAILNKDHLYIYLLIILCATFSTETVLSLQRGVLFYAVLTSLFFFKARAQKNIASAE